MEDGLHRSVFHYGGLCKHCVDLHSILGAVGLHSIIGDCIGLHYGHYRGLHRSAFHYAGHFRSSIPLRGQVVVPARIE